MIQQLASKLTVCIICSVRSEILEINKQALLFNSGDLSYFVILRYKLGDLIKNYDNFVIDPIKGDFQKTLSLFQTGRKSLVEYNGFAIGCIQHVNAW